MMPDRLTRLRVPATLAIGLSVLGASLTGCDDPVEQTIPPIPIVTAIAATDDVPLYRLYPGKTKAIRSMPVYARVTGILEHRLFRPGSFVSPGDVLFKIQDEPFRSERDSALAAVGAAVADQRYAQSQVDRNQKLVKEGAVSKEYFDQLESQLVDAKAKVNSTRSDLVAAQLNLIYCNVQVPDVPPENRYRIGDAAWDEGTLVGPEVNAELATVIQISPLRMVFSPAGAEWPTYLQQVNAGRRLPVTVSVPTDSDFERTGFIDFVDNQVDAQTSTIEMWSDIDNDDVILLPGQYVSIRVLLQTYEDTVVVPTTAILSTADSQYVWTMVDGKPTQAKLTLGPEHAGVTAVLSGLEAGATIVTQGGNRIRPGAAVQIVTPDAWDKANSNASAATTGAQGN